MENINVCDTCVYGTVLVTDELLCSKYGVLTGNTPCKHHKEDLTKKFVRKKRAVKFKNLEK